MYYTLSPGGERPAEHRADCAVDQPLKPGVLYGTEQPIALRARENALYEGVGLGLLAKEPSPDLDIHPSDPGPGTGGPLKLVERARPPQPTGPPMERPARGRRSRRSTPPTTR